MRLATLLFAALAAISSTTQAFSCKPVPGLPPRPETSVRHDQEVEEFHKSLVLKLAADSDVDTAWVGYLLAKDADDNADLAEPPPPRSGLAHFLRFVQCSEDARCGARLSEWMAVEPDNIFVLAVAAARHDEKIAAAARGKLAHADRYDDHLRELHALIARIGARYDTSRPSPPPGYIPAPCRFAPDDSFESIVTFVVLGTAGDLLEQFSKGNDLDAGVRLRLADRLLRVTGSPLAAFTGARLGRSAAATPIDREHWCRLDARADAYETTLGELLLPTSDQARALRADFERALSTRNAFDAIDTVAARLPADDRPDPLDDKEIAACIAGSAAVD